MDFSFSPEQESLRKKARDFARHEVTPWVEEMEENDHTPLPLIQKTAEQGFLGITLPPSFGGGGKGQIERLIVLEEIGRVSAALSISLVGLQLGAAFIATAGSKEQKEKYLYDLGRGKRLAAIAATESSGGSNPSGITTTALEKSDHYLLNGCKKFISNSHICNMAVVLARTGTSSRDFSCFIVDDTMEGFRPGRKENKIGFRGCTTGEIILENVKVPKENLLGTPGQGLSLALQKITEYGRTGITGVALGIMQASLDAAVKFANERVLNGKPISTLSNIQFRLADMYADLTSARLMAYRTAWLLDQGKKADLDIAAVKFYTTEAAMRCTRKAMEVMGGYGCLKEYGVERFLRDSQMLVPSDGTNDIQRMIAGRIIASSYNHDLH